MVMLSGTNVGVIWGSVKGQDGKPVLYVLGEGTYVGEVIPSLEKGADFRPGLDFLTPKIVLQDGQAVYGCECFWGDKSDLQSTIKVHEAMGATVRQISLAQAIEISKRVNETCPAPVSKEDLRRDFITTLIVTAGNPVSAESSFMGTVYLVTHETGRTEEEIIQSVRRAVEQFLITTAGIQAHEEACGNFCWWDLPPYLDDIKPYLPGWMLAIRHIDPDQMAFTDQNIPFA